MIIRHLPVKSGKKSSFARLVQYITNELGKHERLGITQISNCQSQTIDWAIAEVEATQAQNQRAISDKTYHVLVSFPAGETPSREALRDIEATICASIGLGEHQRISAVHHDTDNMHIHLAINKIHPVTHNLHEPWLAYKTFGKTAERLEIKHRLQKTNHQASRSISENHANDLEHHTGIESLLSWVRKNCLAELQQTESWEQFHQILAQHNLSIKERGNGLILTDNQGIFIKASTIARDLSKPKLEGRLGLFTAIKGRRAKGKHVEKPFVARPGKNPPPRSRGRFASFSELEGLVINSGKGYSKKPIITPVSTDELFKKYSREMADIKIHHTQALVDLRKQKQAAITRIKKNAQLKRLAIQLLNERGSSKRMLYSLVSKTCKAELAKLNDKYLELRAKIPGNNQWRTWVDWLKYQAIHDNKEALEVLRSRDIKRPLTGNTVSGQQSGAFIKTAETSLDSITKSGTVIWHTGNTAIRDDGKTLKVSNTFTDACLKEALSVAVQRYGNTIHVKGSDTFKNSIVNIAIQTHPDITFSDPILEKKRQDLSNNQKKEQNNANYRREFKPGRTTGSSLANAAGTPDGRGVFGESTANITKPNIERPGRKPPPPSQNRLRTMSELGLVQFSDRSEMLLQGDVSCQLEHEGTQSDHQLRRDVSGAGIAGIRAAEKYIAERESKRLEGMDIFQHRLFNKTDDGVFEFAGVRTVNSQNLALLKSGAEIVVYPVEKKSTSKLRKLTIGDKISLTVKGISLKKSRRL